MGSDKNSYLTFIVGEETFGINVVKVMEIREYAKPKALPQTLPFVKGVVEFQDEVIPLVDTGLKFGMTPISIDDSTIMIVLQLMNQTLSKTFKLAILVDSVSDVMECEDSEMKKISDDYKPGYIHSTYSKDNKFVYILNPDVVFNEVEIISMMDSIKSIDISDIKNGKK